MNEFRQIQMSHSTYEWVIAHMNRCRAKANAVGTWLVGNIPLNAGPNCIWLGSTPIHMCYDSYVGNISLNDSFMCAMTHSYVCHDSFMCAMTDSYVPWLIRICHDPVEEMLPTNQKELWHIYMSGWVTTHIDESWHIWMSHGAHKNK